MVWESSWSEGATSSSSSFHFHFSLVVNTAFLLLVHVQKETLCRELLSPPLTASQKRICIVTSVFPVYCTCRIFEIIFHMYVWFFEITNNTFSNSDKYKLSEFGLIFLFKNKNFGCFWTILRKNFKMTAKINMTEGQISVWLFIWSICNAPRFKSSLWNNTTLREPI